MFDNLSKDLRINQVHENESLEDGVGELWCGFEKLLCLRRFRDGHCLHLRKDVKELWRWDLVQGLGDGVCAFEVGW